jgi:hypothetical protein
VNLLRSCCNSCFTSYEVKIEPEQRMLIAHLAGTDGMATCPRCGVGRLNLLNDDGISQFADKLKEPIHLTGEEFYQASHGMGLPDEIPGSPELVEALLKSSAVVGVSLEQVGTRIYLHELRLAGGSTIHLCAGGRGAQVLKVTRTP